MSPEVPEGPRGPGWGSGQFGSAPRKHRSLLASPSTVRSLAGICSCRGELCSEPRRGQGREDPQAGTCEMALSVRPRLSWARAWGLSSPPSLCRNVSLPGFLREAPRGPDRAEALHRPSPRGQKGCFRSPDKEGVMWSDLGGRRGSVPFLNQAVEKLFQTPGQSQTLIHGQARDQTETVSVCLRPAVTFILAQYSSPTPGIWGSPALSPPFSPKQLKTKLIKTPPPTHQQLALCPG